MLRDCSHSKAASPWAGSQFAPRSELGRIKASRTTPRVDTVDVWVIPCITVRKTARGRGIALASIEAAVAYAAEKGAPRRRKPTRAPARARTGDDNAFYGTEPLFRRAGFRVIRTPPENYPRNWIPRVTMRIETRSREPTDT